MNTNNIILFDDDNWGSLLPLSYTKPAGELRVGILTVREKWEKRLNGSASYITQDYLSEKYPIKITSDNIVINSRLMPNDQIALLVKELDSNEAILYDDVLLAARLNDNQFQKLINDQDIDELKGIDINNQKDIISILKRPHDIFKLNAQEIKLDYDLITKNRYSKAIPENCRVINESNIFIEEGAEMNFVTLNATDGPIYIGANTTIMEGALIRGPFALCDHSTVKMGAKIYSGTTIGPYSKVGGELSNVVIQAYTNKAHDGFLGNSVIGEWCNIGADTNCSNLKNNYGWVKIWDYTSESFKISDMQFCGLIMGDHSKAGINTMFNTGTVVGVSANIFGAAFPRTFIPSFSWGGHAGFQTYNFEKAIEVAEKVMARRNIELSAQDKTILEHILHSSIHYRTWQS